MAVVLIELEIEGQPRPVAAELDGTLEAVLAEVRKHLPDGEVFVFERDCDDPFEHAHGRRAISLVAHRVKRVEVNVNFEHRAKHHDFSPSVTVGTVLRWAVGPSGFALDANQVAQANLMLPGASEPLTRDTVIGTLFGNHQREPKPKLTLELTLKSFTNGRG